MLFYIVMASILESLVSFSGILFLFMNTERLRQYIHYFVSFSVGAFLAIVFFDIIPEAVAESSLETVLPWVLVGFLFFFLLSRFIHWYHCHEEEGGVCLPGEKSASGYLVLAGDIVHNFIDGIAIALAFMADFHLGVITTAAILLHEFPQEASDFFIMIHSGFSAGKAFFFNFLISLSTLAGAILTYFLAGGLDRVIGPALGIVAGNFLYIAASDLVPELHLKHRSGAASTTIQFSLILFGILLMYFVTTLISK